METLLFSVGFVGNVISILVFASPIKTFWRIVKNRSTEEFDPSPYVFTLLGSSLWVYYGLMTRPGGLPVATVNAVGVVLEAIYVSLFLVFAAPTTKGKTATMVAILNVGFLSGVILITHFACHEQLRVWLTGAISACLNLFMYASPLAVMKTVIRMKSVKYMPFLLSFFLFLNGGVWTLYAVLDRDAFLGIANGIGFILGTAQLILYLTYMGSKASKQTNGVDGCRQPLVAPSQEDDEMDISSDHQV
ncbi:bidirectional sugar transporter SWEET17 [Iris pallida]|uniref:Bidirectional sugar transporter SWEET n=1 Tax=Iris pallida TaxID=29817 RepID=A0AAX6I6W3_IRIPA|nr:bidirectional sugar transporter SWEET17 [Iris pallida]